MEYKELLNEIKNPEKEICECKTSFSEWEDIAKTIAAFSTKRGGKIFVGIDRKGCPCGTLCAREISGKLQTLANYEIKPAANISVEITNHDPEKDLVIVCINVNKGNGVYSYKNVHYERRGDVNHPLTGEEIFELQKNIKKLYFDEMACFSEERPALISDIDENKTISYVLEVKGIEEQLDLRRFLANNSFLVNGTQQVKNSAIMIFGKNPQKFIPQLRLSLSIFPGKVITDDFQKKEFVGDIYEIFKGAFLELKRTIKTYSFVEGAQRFDVPEYPLPVLRECLMNAIVHRDYFDKNTEIFIKFFTNRIEIVNPAKFPFENISFDEIKKTKLSKRRNPMLAEFFESIKLMEKEGRGLARIEEGMKEHGLPNPIFEVTENTFMVTLFNLEDKEKLKNSPYKKVVDFSSLNNRQQLLVNEMSKKKGISFVRADYMNLLKNSEEKITNLTASRDLDELVKKNVLSKIGEKRGTRYFVT
jgi:ATP-dependent DNA helicase RecG